MITKYGNCFSSYRNELIKEPTMIQILDVDGLHVISVLHARLGILTEIALKHRAKRP